MLADIALLQLSCKYRGNDREALESPGFESHTDILSLFCQFVYVVSIITARQRTLLMKIKICNYFICDGLFSHMGQEYPFLWLSEICLGLLVSYQGKIAVSNCPSLLYEPPHDKTNKMNVRPAKTQISLGIHPVYQSLRCLHKESLGP